MQVKTTEHILYLTLCSEVEASGGGGGGVAQNGIEEVTGVAGLLADGGGGQLADGADRL